MPSYTALLATRSLAKVLFTPRVALAVQPFRSWSFLNDSEGMPSNKQDLSVENSNQHAAGESHGSPQGTTSKNSKAESLEESKVSSGQSKPTVPNCNVKKAASQVEDHFDIATYPHKKVKTPSGCVLYPRSPGTAYSLFCKDKFKVLSSEQRKNSLISLAEIWYNTDAEKKKSYNDAMCALRARYKLAMAAFHERHPNVDIRVVKATRRPINVKSPYNFFIRDYFIEKRTSSAMDSASLSEAAARWRLYSQEERDHYVQRLAPNGMRLVSCEDGELTDLDSSSSSTSSSNSGSNPRSRGKPAAEKDPFDF